jgi:hypothetical protein
VVRAFSHFLAKPAVDQADMKVQNFREPMS